MRRARKPKRRRAGGMEKHKALQDRVEGIPFILMSSFQLAVLLLNCRISSALHKRLFILQFANIGKRGPVLHVPGEVKLIPAADKLRGFYL